MTIKLLRWLFSSDPSTEQTPERKEQYDEILAHFQEEVAAGRVRFVGRGYDRLAECNLLRERRLDGNWYDSIRYVYGPDREQRFIIVPSLHQQRGSDSRRSSLRQRAIQRFRRRPLVGPVTAGQHERSGN